MKQVRLTTSNDLRNYASLVKSSMGVQLSDDYMNRGEVVVWFDDDGDLVGGHAVILEPPFLVLEVISEELYDSWFAEQVSTNQVCELNGVFLTEKFYEKNLQTSVLARGVFRHFVNSGRTCGLFGYDREQASLERLYRRKLLSPVPLFEGELALPARTVTPTNVFLGYFRADHIRKSFRFGTDE